MRFAGLLVASTLLIGCQSYDDRVASATSFVDEYLEAASGRDELRGWSMLGSDIKLLMFSNNIDLYLNEVRGADWDGLSWDVDNITADDDFILVRVRATQGAFPSYLTEQRANLTISPGSGAVRTFAVRFGPFLARELRAAGG